MKVCASTPTSPAATLTWGTAEVSAVTGKNAELLSILNHTAMRFLDENARRWVDMQSLFSFMKIS